MYFPSVFIRILLKRVIRDPAADIPGNDNDNNNNNNYDNNSKNLK